MTTIQSKRLLVEGKNDAHVLFSLFDKHGICFGSEDKSSEHPESIFIQKIFTNKDKDVDPIQFFSVQLKFTSESGCLGIILDADFNLEGNWMALRNRLVEFGFSESAIDAQRKPTGTIIREKNMPTVGIWLMPDNILEGELEHFLELLVPRKEENPLWLRVLNALEDMPPENSFPSYVKRFKEQDRRKAMIHTWLAWQEAPGKPLGQALTARYFDAHAPHALVFINWIRQLFSLNPPSS